MSKMLFIPIKYASSRLKKKKIKGKSCCPLKKHYVNSNISPHSMNVQGGGDIHFKPNHFKINI